MAKSRVTPTILSCGGWTGMRYSAWTSQSDATKAIFALNGYVDPAGPGSPYRSRPGRYRVSSTALASPGQLVHQFAKNDGTQYTVAISGGKFYTLNWGTSTWTETLSAANLSAASITLSSTARCYGLTFNNTMVISDGVNTPWTWDGTSGGGLTKLTNAPVFYGQPTVRAGKLFGIKNSDRATIVWSNENDATTGYESGGYSNFWALIQQGSEGLEAIRGTNDSLVYWRAGSIGTIYGDFGAEFQTTNTFDSVSNLIGTRSPRGVLYYNDTFYFPDQRGRPWMLRQGGTPEPLWQQVSPFFPLDTGDAEFLGTPIGYASTSAVDLAAMETIPLHSTSGVLFCNSTNLNSGDDTHGALYYDTSGTAQGFWLWLATTAGVGASGSVLNSTTSAMEVLQVEEDGYTYALGKSGQWIDQQSSGATQGVPLIVITPYLGVTSGVEMRFERANVVLGSSSDGDVDVSLRSSTSTAPSGATPLTATATSTFNQQERRVCFGLNRSGRWYAANIQIEHANTSDNFSLAFQRMSVVAFADNDSPGFP